VLNAADSVFFDSNCPSGMQALGAGPCRFLAAVL
jgi:hypothetical protein